MNGTETIQSRLREPGHGLVIAMALEEQLQVNRKTTQTYKAWFFKVTKTAPYYHEYEQLPSFTEGDFIDYSYLGDGGIGTGEDILRNEIDDYHVLHFGYAPESPNLRVYENVSPSSDPNRAVDREGQPDFPNPKAGSQTGFITSRQIYNKYSPPRSTERVSFRNDDDGEFLHFGFRAENDISAQNATLHLTGAGYKLAPVTSTQMQDEMVSIVTDTTSATESDAPPTVMTTVGGIDTFRLGTNEPDDWDTSHSRVIDYGIGDV
jgi:hypothetical protein